MKKQKFKVLLVLFFLATGMMFQSAAIAQSDGFFRNISYNTDRDGESIYNLNNQTFGQDVVPLGDGLLVFAALGAGYAVVRRKRKRTTIFFIALSLLFGLNQCKKKVETINPNNLGDETVHIRVNVNGAKHDVNPNTGVVVYTEGDKIYVGNGDQYLGELTYESGGFSGEITKPAVGDYLHFYFVGGLTLENFSLTSTKVSIKDQSSSLPVLSYGKSNRAYTEGNATYSCTLLNKCALVKFVLAKGTNDPVKLIDLATSATINFNVTNPDNAITAAGYDDEITLNSESETVKWGILLPQNAVNGANVCIGDADYYKVNIPKIEANDYISNGIGIDNTGVAISVGENSKVYFSPGNLQYNPSTQSWKFADNQYVFIGSANSHISPTYNGWLDLFGWGTGDNPTNSSVENNDYANFTDWGDNCGDPTGHGYKWETLNYNQWLYLFEHHKYGPSAVHGVFGYVVLPDGATADVSWPYTDDEWEALEAQGALFFPAAGSREGTIVSSVGLSGGYWSSTKYFYNNDDAIWLYIYENDYYVNGCEKSIGNSVRLVRDASYTYPLNKASK